METQWRDGGNWPDWRDSGKRAEVDLDGQLRDGVLFADDFFFDGEDELPIFIVKFPDGSTASFADVRRWRITE